MSFPPAPSIRQGLSGRPPLERLRRLLSGATAIAAAGSIVAAVVALAPSHALADVPGTAACESLYRGNPRGSLHLATSPAGGSSVRPGETIRATVTWNTADWDLAELHKVLDCVLVEGEVRYDLSHQEKPTANDGLFTYDFTVPAGARTVCDRARLSARPRPGVDLVVQKSNVVCFEVTGRVAPHAPTTGTAAESPLAAPTVVVAAEQLPAPMTEMPAASAPSEAGAPADVLPRTGSAVLALTGLGVACLAGGRIIRLMRRASSPAADGRPS